MIAGRSRDHHVTVYRVDIEQELLATRKLLAEADRAHASALDIIQAALDWLEGPNDVSPNDARELERILSSTPNDGPRKIWIKNIADVLALDIKNKSECEVLCMIHVAVSEQASKLRRWTGHKCTFIARDGSDVCVSCGEPR